MKPIVGICILYLLTLSCSTPKAIQLIKIAENEGKHYGPAEPSIAVSPLHPEWVVGGSILDRVHYSSDGGQTFGHTFLKSPLGVFGDPVLWADHLGNFYYVHLGTPGGGGRNTSRYLESLVIHQSIDSGKSWDEGTAIGTNPPKNQDKPWIASDPLNGDLVVTWTEFDKYASTQSTDKSRIRFSKSADQGKTWTQAITISDHEGDCLDDDYTPEGAVPAYGLHHQIYVVWAFDQKLWFDKSLDGGLTWLPKDQEIMDQSGGWSLDVPGLGRANGMPVTCTDLSINQYRGSIYVCWADLKNGEDNMDVWIMHSRDEGRTWSQRIKVNQDTGPRYQFLPWMSVDPATGYIYIVYYDRRNHADTQTDVVVATSKDGGNTFKEILLTGSTFTPPGNEVFFGDYNGISAANGIIRPIWTSYADKKLSVWTAIINEKGVKKNIVAKAKS